MVLGFMGFAHLVIQGWVIDLKLMKIVKFCLDGHIKTFHN